MDNKKKGSSRTSGNTSRGKAGSGKSKPAFAFDKSSGKRGEGRSAGKKEERSTGTRGASRTSSSSRGTSFKKDGSPLGREEKKAISDSNFKKRSGGGFTDKRQHSSTAGFDKKDKPSSGPRTKRADSESSFGGKRGASDRPSSGPRGKRTDSDASFGNKRTSSAGSARSARPSSGEGRSERSSSTRGARPSAGGRGERSEGSERSTRSSSTRGARPAAGGRSERAGGSERGERSTGTGRKPSGFGKETKGPRSFDKTPNRAPKSFGRGSSSRDRDSDRGEGSGFNEDEFFGKSSERSVQDELNARKSKFGPKKTAAKAAPEKISKRAEKSLVRKKVDKDFIDIKFSREKATTDSIHKELNVKKARSKAKGETQEEGGIRLNRYLSNAGVASRREADQFIQEGLVKVNGKVVTELGTKVQPGDTVKYGNKVISPEKPVYVLLNKPKDFITTTDDPQERRTVMALVANACKERIVPVGRLDRNTTGLLLFTNDGELAQKLTHPSSNIKKIYLVELDKPIAEKDFELIKTGKLRLFDGPVKVDDLAVTDHTRRILGIEIHEGRNRIVRRIFEELGYQVEKLDRVAYAGLTKKDLSRGKWRFLSAQEINRLKYLE